MKRLLKYAGHTLNLFMFTFLIVSLPAYADQNADFKYNDKTGHLRLNIQQRPLGEVFKQLAKELGFELKFEVDGQRLISSKASGSAYKILEKLARPDSVAFKMQSIADTDHFRVTQVWVVRKGNQSSNFIPEPTRKRSQPMTPQQQANERRRQERHAQGLGRRFQHMKQPGATEPTAEK